MKKRAAALGCLLFAQQILFAADADAWRVAEPVRPPRTTAELPVPETLTAVLTCAGQKVASQPGARESPSATRRPPATGGRLCS